MIVARIDSSGILMTSGEIIEVDNRVKVNQILTNGNFENGLDSWNFNSVQNDSIILENDILKFTTDGTIPTSVSGNLVFNHRLEITHQYYAFTNVKYVGTMRLKATTYLMEERENNGEWIKLSGLITSNGTFNRPFGIVIMDKVPTDVEVKDLFFIDLTETFGEGKEPSKEVCDRIFANYYENNGFVELEDIKLLQIKNGNVIVKELVENVVGSNLLSGSDISTNTWGQISHRTWEEMSQFTWEQAMSDSNVRGQIMKNSINYNLKLPDISTTGFKNVSGIYSTVGTITNGNIRFEPKNFIDENGIYSLSFKYKTISGKVTHLGGHFVGMGDAKVFLDGKDIGGSWYGAFEVPNDGLEHTIVFSFKVHDKDLLSTLYIQPNRDHYSFGYEMEIWDVEFRKGELNFRGVRLKGNYLKVKELIEGVDL